ncbi:hypothetical protein GCM10009632_04890 [Mycolicibacterium alvei]|uniref:Uncharacterized protein n=1 Tax=Mycolicibacterium alvei TaxID=67081 RepID=A0A6N4UZT4_9MYCO|nr:hypothetical protein MALV_56910 [Mycolicibacterium alvei]
MSLCEFRAAGLFRGFTPSTFISDRQRFGQQGDAGWCTAALSRLASVRASVLPGTVTATVVLAAAGA